MKFFKMCIKSAPESKEISEMTLEEYETLVVSKRSRRFSLKFCSKNTFGTISVLSALMILMDKFFVKIG